MKHKNKSGLEKILLKDYRKKESHSAKLDRNVNVGECKGRQEKKKSQWQLLCPASLFILPEGSGSAPAQHSHSCGLDSALLIPNCFLSPLTLFISQHPLPETPHPPPIYIPPSNRTEPDSAKTGSSRSSCRTAVNMSVNESRQRMMH